MIYITGDKHGDIQEIEMFAKEHKTSKDDILILLGDAGFNYYRKKDRKTNLYHKIETEDVYQYLKKIDLTILVVQGNHEAPAWCCDDVHETFRFGNTLYQANDADNIYYLKNGEIYWFNEKSYLVLGGAFSVDRNWRHIPYTDEEDSCCGYYFPEEQMSDDQFKRAWESIKEANYSVYGVLSHTCPKPIVPLYAIDKILANDRMETKLEEIASQLLFDIWYFGHFHDNRIIQKKYHMLFEQVVPLE